ncbi:hypothetical protein ACR9GK_19665 [Enterobacter hormaechei subsp. steigerwaltii]
MSDVPHYYVGNGGDQGGGDGNNQHRPDTTPATDTALAMFSVPLTVLHAELGGFGEGIHSSELSRVD